VSASALEIDERLSWARREDDAVRVHLRLSGAVLAPGTASIELVSASERFRSPAVVTTAEGATVVVVSLPQSELGRSTWRLSIQTSANSGFTPIQARLVAAPTSPVALLPGPAPATRMRPPSPSTRRPAALRLAARLPVPVRRMLLRARAWGRAASRRTR
jgi:hypothetical protein